MALVDANGVYADNKDWECYSHTPENVIKEINSLVYGVITNNSDPIVAQKIIYDTFESRGYGKYGFRDSECDRCTTNIINQYYGSNIDRWANLRLKAEKKGEKWIHKVPTCIKQQTQEKKTMTLSNKTIQNLASALKQEVIDYIHEDERYAQMMHETITDAIVEKLGPVDEEVLHELAFAVMDVVCLH